MSKKLRLIVITTFLVFFLCSCGEISTFQFYKACLTGNEQIVEKFISQENNSLELSEKEETKFLKSLAKHEKIGFFSSSEIEDLFLGDPLAVSVLGNNISIVKNLCENTSVEIFSDNLLYVTCILNNTEIAHYLYEKEIYPVTYRSIIAILANDNVELLKLYFDLIEEPTEIITEAGENLLMIAADKNAAECVKYLVNSKLFDLDVYNSDYETALDLAIGSYYYRGDEVKNVLKKANANYFSSSMKDYMRKFENIKNKMLEYCDSSYSYYDKYEVMDEYRNLTKILGNLKKDNYSKWEWSQFVSLLDKCQEASNKLLYSSYYY